MQILIISAVISFTLSIAETQNVDIFCGEPPDIPFSSVSDVSNEEYSLGTTVTYACQYGYSFSGQSRTLQCVQSDNEDGAEWTEPHFSCSPQSCGDPGYINNGHRVGFRFTFPNSVRYECEDGYKLKGLSTRYCQTSGSWSGKLPSCEVVTCKQPRDLDNGQVFYNSLEYLSELKYKCNKGYNLNTGETVYCTADGQWSKADVACIESTCDSPLKPEHGFMQLAEPGSKPQAGTIVIYSCDDDRIADGPTTTKCLETGQWTFPPPKCLKPCSIPYVSNGIIGRYVKRSYYSSKKDFKQVQMGVKIEDNEELFLHCSKGYEASGSQENKLMIYCSKGKWSSEPHCEPASCRSYPPRLENTEILSVNPDHGGRVLYRCIPNYKKIKNETVVCDFGEWKGMSKICKSTQCSVDMLNYPGLLKRRKSTYKDGETFEIECEWKYQVAYAGEIRCEDGEWKGSSEPCVAARCEVQPPAINYGWPEISSTAHGSVVDYVCEEPYMLSERSQVKCSFGEWKGQPPRCEDTRCHLKHLKKSSHVSEETPTFTKSGERLNVICKIGYSPRIVKPLCLNGRWTSGDSVSVCREDDCLIPLIQHGDIIEEQLGDWYWIWSKARWGREVKHKRIPIGTLVTFGTTYILRCDDRYSFQGSSVQMRGVTCTEGRWRPDPVCLRVGTRYIPTTPVQMTSVNPATSDFSRVRTSTIMSQTTPLPVISTSTEAQISVDSDVRQREVTTTFETYPAKEECTCEYNMSDDKVVATVDGKQLNFGDKVKDGSVVVFRCKHVGFHRFYGQKEVKCENCLSWHSSQFPTCVDPGVDNAVIIYGSAVNVSVEGNLEVQKGQHIKLRCFLLGSDIFPNWTVPIANGITLTQERKESTNLDKTFYVSDLQLKNADVENEGTYECRIGNQSSTAVDLIVIDPNLRCPEFPEDDEIDIMYDNERRVKSKATFSCKYQDREFIGKAVLTCLRDGQWSDPPPKCHEKKCKELKETELLKIFYTKDREIGSLATFHCLAAKRTGALNATCLENGLWSDPIPNCEHLPCSREALLSSTPKNVVVDVDDIKEDKLPYNTTVKMACVDNMVLVGSPLAICKKNGTWEIESIPCLPGCPSLKKNAESKLKVEPEKDIYNLGESATISCPPGMKLNTESQVMMCMKKGWSEAISPECL